MRITADQWRALHDSKGKSLTKKAKPGAKTPKKEPRPVKMVRPLAEKFDGGIVVVTWPIRVVSLSNLSQREHWTTKSKRARVQREKAALACHYGFGFMGWRNVHVRAPLLVTLTRLAPRRLDRSNNVAALKHCQDGCADAIGIDDGSPLLDWDYQQERSKAYGVKITIERRPG